jgi:putative endonuclease
MNTAKRRKAFIWGIIAEWIACLWLLLKGYRVISRRFHSKFGEIDIIAKKGKYLVFVEVKARKNKKLCAHAITYTKQQKMLKAIRYFLKIHSKKNEQIRIDAIYICPYLLPQHIKNIMPYCCT